MGQGLDRSGQLVGSDCADVTEVLGHDQVRLRQAKGRLIKLIESASCRDQFFDLAVNVFAAVSMPSYQWFNHHGDVANRWGKITFMADADELIGEAEGCDDFCGTWNKRANSHSRTGLMSATVVCGYPAGSFPPSFV